MKTYIDTIPKNVTHGGDVIAEGKAYVATNGMVVILSQDECLLTIVKGQKILQRSFETPISKKWLVRRIEGFADDMKAQKLPRGPRPKTDQEIIAAPIKRIRIRQSAKAKGA